ASPRLLEFSSSDDWQMLVIPPRDNVETGAVTANIHHDITACEAFARLRPGSRHREARLSKTFRKKRALLPDCRACRTPSQVSNGPAQTTLEADLAPFRTSLARLQIDPGPRRTDRCSTTPPAAAIPL